MNRVLRFIVVAGAVSGFSRADTLLSQAYDDMYNLQFETAHQQLSAYEQQHPADPMGPVSDAAACLFSEFQRLHILESEFLTNDKKVLNSRQDPDPSVKARFNQDLQKTETLTNTQMNVPSERANAMLARPCGWGSIRTTWH